MNGIGTDIIEIERIQHNIESYGDKFLDKILTPAEKAYCLQYKQQAPHVAGRFAAKEAVAKALGSGFGQELEFHDIEVLNEPNGKPFVRLSSKATHLFQDPHVQISISHCKSYAIAFALVS